MIEIPKGPRQKERYCSNRVFARSARMGLEHLFRKVWPPNCRILLPSYIGISPLEGSGVFDPIQACGIQYGFFRTNELLEADFSDLEKQIEQSKPFAVLLIHYFGFPQPKTIEIKKLCESQGIILIEDCAHTFESRIGSFQVGTIGDVSIFSLHKILPCEDGGILQINNSKFSVPSLEADQICAASTIETFCNAELSAISAQRRKNYLQLEKLVRSVRNVSVFYPRLNEETVPLNLPVLIKNKDRFELYKDLRNQNIGVTSLYHTLIPEIRAEDFPISHQISRDILNLPIHQDISKDQLEYLAAALDRSVNQTRS